MLALSILLTDKSMLHPPQVKVQLDESAADILFRDSAKLYFQVCVGFLCTRNDLYTQADDETLGPISCSPRRAPSSTSRCARKF